MKYMKLGSKPDSFQTLDNNNRVVATELASDFIVNVGEVKFYLHKYPLLSKSVLLQKLVAEENKDEIDLPDIPGGHSTFELCAKFCYGVTVTLNPHNVVAARCAAEYLEMYETVEKGNLIHKIEVFFNSSIFRGWKDSIIVLQTSKAHLPFSEELKIVSRAIDSIVSKVSTESVPMDSWIHDLCELDLDLFKKVIMGIMAKGIVSSRIIGHALKAYTYKRNVLSYEDVTRNREMLETIVCLLPIEKGSVSCSFLIKLLKGAILFDSSDSYKKELVKRIGLQLNEALVSDLLIIYDIDVVINIVEEFSMQEMGSGKTNQEISEELLEDRDLVSVSDSSKLAVLNLIDGYLYEISKDPKTDVVKFIELVEVVSSYPRPIHDGLYRAVDMFLKEHPDLSKAEKKRLCNLVDCRKLTPEACAHAIQNESLPLRQVVQILYFEQIRQSSENNAAYNNGHHESVEWNKGVPHSEDLNASLKSMNVSDKKKLENNKAKGGLISKKLLGKLWSTKLHSGENSSSDTSESTLGSSSINPEETKSTNTPRHTRNSVS